MGDLLWPGLHRAEIRDDGTGLLSEEAFLEAMGAVELAWAQSLERAGLAPPGTSQAWQDSWEGALAAGALDPAGLAQAAEAGGNPVIPMLAVVRRGMEPAAASAVHRGLTSQDVVDTALMCCLRAAFEELAETLARLVRALAQFAERHRDTAALAHTLGQAALPTTLGRRAAAWLQGCVASLEQVRQVQLPVQCGDAIGTAADVVDRFAAAGAADPIAATRHLTADLAGRLGLVPADPWHTTRTPITRVADALVTTSDALGHFAADVLAGARTGVDELAEPAGQGRGASSTMPQKRNPILSVLIRRHAMSAPLLGAGLHLASAQMQDARPCGPWHTEWVALRDLTQRTVTAAAQAAEVAGGLEVDLAAVSRNLDAALPAVLAQRLQPALAQALPGGAAHAGQVIASCDTPQELRSAVAAHVPAAERDDLLDPAAYLGLAGAIVDRAVERSEAVLAADSASPDRKD